MTELLLAFEGGGTKTRIVLADVEGNVRAREQTGPASPLYIDRTSYAEDIRARMTQLKNVADSIDGNVTRAGLAGPLAMDIVTSAINETFGGIEIRQFGENDVALALYDLDWGVSLVAGTGATCRAKTADGTLTQCGGFGPQFGDEGSGYWIGRAAIAAAMMAHDQCGPATALTEAICRKFAIENVFHILKFIDHSGHVPGPRVASLTPQVFATARQGDHVARNICSRAGAILGRLTVDTVRNAGFVAERIPVVMTGGVLHGGPLVITALERELRRSGLPLEIYPVVPEPVEGLIKLLKRP